MTAPTWPDSLRNRFPNLFPPDAGRWEGEVRCDPGWEKLLTDLLVGLSAIENPDLRVALIKEKFGGLRVHLAGRRAEDMPEIERLIGIAKAAADVTCEQCGAPGELRCVNRWYAMRCDPCETIKQDRGSHR